MSILRIDTLIPFTSGSTTISINALLDATASYSLTSSYAMNGGGGGGFPYTGSADITGSLNVVGPTTVDTNPLIFLNNGFLGSKVTFEKTPYSSSQIDIITAGVTEIARGNNQGIYNAATEGGYVQYTSPDGTEWNSIYTDPLNYGWGELQSVSSRTYDTWYNAVNSNAGSYIIELPMVMHDLNTGKYYLFKFHKWTPGNNGGGFAYDRYEIINLPVSTSFTKPDYSSSIQDTISAGVVIARDNQQGLYNSVVEALYDNIAYQSPLYTRWNSVYTDPVNYGWNNLGNVRNRVFDTWRNAVNANPPDSVSSSLQLVMHDITTDQYYKVMFTQWTQGGNGGGFAYDRTLILPEAAIVFPDGTSQTTAPIIPPISATQNNTLYSIKPATSGFGNASDNIFFGNNAGYSVSSNVYESNFLGNNAGNSATMAFRSNFLGTQAGQQAYNSNNSNFFGNQAGYQAAYANQSNFIGYRAGYLAVSASSANFLGQQAGYLATNALLSNFIGSQAGYTATDASNSNFLGTNSGNNATNAYYSNFLGYQAGLSATNAYQSNFLGLNAGYQASSADNSNFLGYQSGYQAYSASLSNFLGPSAGINASNAKQSNFLGNSAGNFATNASSSNFIGDASGYYAAGAGYSNFIGGLSGFQAYSAAYSNFLGYRAGYQSSNASYSTLLGYQVGYNAGSSISSNNIIIGTNITLPNGTKDSINLGGIIFATGSYSTTTGNPFSGSMFGTGKVGINKVTPTQALDVSGSALISDVLVLPYQNPLPSGRPTGSIATSGSGTTFVGLYLYNGTSWVKLSV